MTKRSWPMASAFIRCSPMVIDGDGGSAVVPVLGFR